MQPRPKPKASPPAPESASTQWSVWIALGIVIAISVLNWNWIWGGLFVAWGVSALIRGQIHFVQMVHRQSAPVLFYCIVLTWVLSGAYLVLVDIAPNWGVSGGFPHS